MQIRWSVFWALLLVVGLNAPPLYAQNVNQPQDTGPPPGTASILDNLPQKGDPNGLRTWLQDRGTTWTVFYTNDVLSNLSGGIKPGTVDQGKIELQVATDLDKVTGLKGLTFYWNAFQIYNNGQIRRDYVGGMNTTD